MSWLSPVFPTGGFAYSAGLEQAAADGLVTSGQELLEWLHAQLRHGSIRNEAILLAQACRCHDDTGELQQLGDLARALAESDTRLGETVNQGRSFALAARHWPECGALAADLPLPVAVGAAAGMAGLSASATAQAYVTSFAINQLQAAIRLSLTGQNGAAALLAGLDASIAETASQAADGGLDAMGGATFRAAIAAMNHETLEPRLFLS